MKRLLAILVMLPSLALADGDEAITKGVAYLASNRADGGFWKTDAQAACTDEGFHVASGALACLAILEAGGLADEPSRKALRGGVEWLVVWGVGAGEKKESDRES